MQLHTSNNRANLVERGNPIVACPFADLAFLPLRVRISHKEPQHEAGQQAAPTHQQAISLGSSSSVLMRD